MSTRTTGSGAGETTEKKLSFLNKYLTLWIFLAIFLGIGLGAAVPGVAEGLNELSVGTTSIPIAIGLILMMWPPLAKVRYEELKQIPRQPEAKKMFGTSLALNYIVGPLLMFSLAWIFLPDNVYFRIGLILTGVARCIAMVIVWNSLAEGDPEYAAILVALNSVFQIALYSFYAYFLVAIASDWVSPGSGTEIHIGVWEVAQSVLIYLGIPFMMGIATRYLLLPRGGAEWYNGRLMPALGKVSLLALLFTIVVMFAFKGEYILDQPFEVVRVAIPLAFYFVIMFFLSFGLSIKLKFDYPHATAQSFTAASNNFELAIAVSIGVFGIGSLVAFAAVIGPLIEVPVLISLVNVAFWIKKRYYGPDGRLLAAAAAAGGGAK
ncbi:MAG: ACR3 family arsenite efflux transporter [Thermoplasmata archaeon]